MADTLRHLRRQLKLVRNIRQITRAMQMVAAARLRRVQQRVTQGRVYWQRMQEIMEDLAVVAQDVEHPLLTARPVARAALVVVSSEKGLCGAYNANIAREANRFLRSRREPVAVTLVGRKAREPLLRAGHAIVAQHLIDQKAFADHALRLARELRRQYEAGEVDEISICYARFVSLARDEPTVAQLLPVPRPEADEADRAGPEYIFEPPAPELLARLLPRYVDAQVYHILLEATASEQAARMRSMAAATENAEDLLGTLTMRANRLRQQEITSELLDIVSGAEALKA
jgi:F-type H+-transporting ATPase subunit gamma